MPPAVAVTAFIILAVTLLLMDVFWKDDDEL